MPLTEDTKLVEQLYNKQFQEYSKKQSEYKVVQALRNYVYNILGDIKNKKILFAGCGDGLECVPATRKGAKITGIDISEKGIVLARKNCPNAEFFLMDFEKTNFKDKSFDIIVSILAVIYKENLEYVLKEFRRVLKQDGLILLVVPHPVRKMIKYNNMNYFVRGKKQEIWRGIKRFNYYRLFEDYFDLFVNSELRVIKLFEPQPIKETEKTPDSEINHPHFLIFKLIKD